MNNEHAERTMNAACRYSFCVVLRSFAGAARGSARLPRRMGRRGRRAAEVPERTDFDGSWHFCRLMYAGAQPAARPGLGHRLSLRRHQFLDPPVRADQDAGRDAGRREREPNHLVVRPTDPSCSVPVRDGLRSRQRRILGRGRRRAAQLPAQGRLPLGRRLLGAVGVGGVRRRDRQGAAAR